jgi:hypothetical protein
MMDDGVTCITAREKDFQSCSSALGFIGELPAIHAWETHIRNQQLDVGNCV